MGYYRKCPWSNCRQTEGWSLLIVWSTLVSPTIRFTPQNVSVCAAAQCTAGWTDNRCEQQHHHSIVLTGSQLVLIEVHTISLKMCVCVCVFGKMYRWLNFVRKETKNWRSTRCRQRHWPSPPLPSPPLASLAPTNVVRIVADHQHLLRGDAIFSFWKVLFPHTECYMDDDHNNVEVSVDQKSVDHNGTERNWQY